MKYEQKHF